jgi:hypothetical protein
METYLALPALMCPRNHTEKLIDSSAYIISEPEAAPALECKAAFDFICWRKPSAPASVPANAQPAQASAVPEAAEQLAGRGGSSARVEAAAAITGAGGVCVDVDAVTSTLKFTTPPASCI